jgi:hypothetical protein
MTRLRLKEHCRPLRRSSGQVQLGLDPARGVVLDGLAEPELALLERLDGTLDESDLRTWAARNGAEPARVARLLATLREHCLTVERPADRADFAAMGPRRLALQADAEALSCAYGRADDGYASLAGRARRHVTVDGSGALPATLAALLRQAGVGSVACGRYAADAAPDDRAPDVVVLAGSWALDHARGRRWLATGVPHLPVVLQGTAGLVGPLVEPGTTACLRCQDLTRADLDPGWPALLAQLLPPGVSGPPDVGGETCLVGVVAAVASMVVLARLDGHAQAPGMSLELRLPWPLPEQRHWPPHAACPCGAATATAEASRPA